MNGEASERSGEFFPLRCIVGPLMVCRSSTDPEKVQQSHLETGTEEGEEEGERLHWELARNQRVQMSVATSAGARANV